MYKNIEFSFYIEFLKYKWYLCIICIILQIVSGQLNNKSWDMYRHTHTIIYNYI